AALDQLLEARIAPGALIMSPGGVEDAALALRAHPRPRLLLVALHAIFQDGASFFVVLGVNVSLIPALEAGEAFHDGVIRLGKRRTEGAGAVLLELGADQVDVFRRIEKAVRGTVQGNEALAALHEIEQRLL